MLKFAEFVRKNYQVIITATVIVGLLLGLWTTTPGVALQRYSQALTFLMILFISLTISPRQFALVARQPGAVAAGLALNFIYMPLLCWALARLLVRDPQLATGIILVGVVPCAGMAAVWTALLKGDVPLGMAINALTMVLGPFLIPPLMVLFAGSSVRINAWAMFQQLAVILLIPLVLGLAIRWIADRLWNVKPYLPLLPALSALTAALLMFAVCNVNVPLIRERWSLVPALLGAVALIFPLGFLVPHWLGRFAFNWQQRVAITYSSGMKNLPIAVGLAFASFSKLAGLPVALAFIVQMLTASLFYRYLNGQATRLAAAGQAGQRPAGAVQQRTSSD
jgi:BASS family bile acid:Na+ symporter